MGGREAFFVVDVIFGTPYLIVDLIVVVSKAVGGGWRVVGGRWGGARTEKIHGKLKICIMAPNQ